MSEVPKVSVIIVSYNNWPDLELAIDSVLQQTLPAHEVIVVDNDSQDGTRQELASRYPGRVRCVFQANVGGAGGRNAGFRVATGDYIQFVDGDDLLAPNKLAKHAHYLHEHPDVDVVYGRYRSFRDEPGVPAAALEDVDVPATDDMRATLIDRGCGPPIAFLFRRSALERIGPMNERLYNEDYEYLLRAAFADCKFAYLPDVCCFYRRRLRQKSIELARVERSNLALFQHVLQTYDLADDYRQMIECKLARLRYAFAHYCLLHGQSRRALGYLRRAQRLCPSEFQHKRPASIAYLARLTGGSAVYGWLRRWRRLPAPFTPATA